MKNGLLIEDDPNKAKKIREVIAKEFNSVTIKIKNSYQSGLKQIFEVNYDFILLDMSLPTYDLGKGNFGGKPRNFGGRDILKEMKRHKKSSKVKVITQYNEFDGGSISLKDLNIELMEKYPRLYAGYIFYNSRSTEWEQELIDFIGEL